MRYPLDCEQTVAQSLLFWLAKYTKLKLNSLSNKLLDSPTKLTNINLLLSQQITSIDELYALAKQARNIGLIGINTYFNPLKKFYEHIVLYRLYSLKQIDEELVIEVLSAITAGLSDASKKNYRIALINFFAYLSKQNADESGTHIYDIELKNWAGVRGSGGTKLPEYMDEDEIKRFLRALDEYDFKENSHRNKLIIKIILFTGVRVSEALRLKLKDISLEAGLYTLRIHAKGNKYRVVILEQSCIKEHLDAYLATISLKSEYLFLNKQGKILTQAYISRMIEQVLLFAGIRKEKNGAHMLRHSFATLLYKREKDLVLVQEALGHASLNTSRIYTHFDNEKLKLAAKIAKSLNE